MSTPFYLSVKLAVVTGARRGIGRAMAQAAQEQQELAEAVAAGLGRQADVLDALRGAVAETQEHLRGVVELAADLVDRRGNGEAKQLADHLRHLREVTLADASVIEDLTACVAQVSGGKGRREDA